MKSILIMLALFASTSLFGQVVKEKIKLADCCHEKKAKLEKVLDVKGVKYASANTETNEVYVVYNSDKIKKQSILELISAHAQLAGEKSKNCKSSCCSKK